MHLVKIAWQDSMRVHELDFHAAFVQRRKEANGAESSSMSRVATVLAGGTVPNTANQFGRIDSFDSLTPTTPKSSSTENPAEIETAFQVKPKKPKREGQRKHHFHVQSVYYLRKGTYEGAPRPGLSDILTSSSQTPNVTTTPPAADPVAPALDLAQTNRITRKRPDHIQCPRKELRWVLFQQVGGRLKSARNVKEMAQVLVDSADGNYNYTPISRVYRLVNLSDV
jgi:hypothetical protein